MTSILPTAAVIVGAPVVPHFTLVNAAVVGVPDAGCLSIKVNEAPAATVGMVNVHGVAEVRVAVMIVPDVITKVDVDPTVPEATKLSVNPEITGLVRFAVVSVGVVPNTNEPVPVSSVIAAIKLALVGVARNVATLAPNPVSPLIAVVPGSP